MAAPATVSEFLDLVRRSGVVEEKRLDAYVEKLRTAESVPAEPAKLAGLLVRDGLVTQFQAEQILLGKWRRFTIGKYKVLERLGSGGMGSVYLCEHKLMRRRVAVKVLPSAKARDESALHRFYREARAVAALDHANIVHAYDIDQDGDLHFLVMEYVDGASLQELIRKTGPMDPIRAAHYIRQAAMGLAAAQQRGLVHRDIKPGNILIDRTGCVKILDMGLARFFNDEDDNLTKKFDENVLGTADYLAPEQAIDSHEVDVRADIYSLGATFYFMLTGKTPFGDGTVAQKLIWHQTRQPKSLASVRPDLPAGMAAVVDKMMAKDPGQRYQTPAALAEALAPWTQTPIGPPAEAEMPRLSLAAAGAAPAPLTDPTVVSSGSAPAAAPSSARTWQVKTPASRPASPSPRPLVPAATAEPVAPVAGQAAAAQPSGALPSPAPSVAPTAAPDREEAPWESLAPDTADLTAQHDTAPASSRSSRRGQPGSLRAQKQERKQLWVVLSIVSLLALAGLVFGLWKVVFSRSGPDTNLGRAVLEVSRTRPNAFRSVQQALRNARPGDVIELWDKEHTENLVVDASVASGTTQVTVQAATGKKVVWTSASKDDKTPIIKFYRARGFHLKGKGITLDGTMPGDKQVQDLVKFNLACPGVLVEDLSLTDFARTAVTFENSGGTKEKRIRLVSLQVSGFGSSKPLAGVYFDADPGVLPPVNDHIEIGGASDFSGLPADRAIKKKDDGVLGSDVRLPAVN
jgi:serine/threonine protein kinase